LEKYPLSPLSKVTIYHALRSPVANKSIWPSIILSNTIWRMLD
jgi:hypothetical protein